VSTTHGLYFLSTYDNLLTVDKRRLERAQYQEMHKLWNAGNDGKHKGPCDTYGAEHLARLLGQFFLHRPLFN